MYHYYYSTGSDEQHKLIAMGPEVINTQTTTHSVTIGSVATQIY